jgi:methylphosphotriester-DNA--protein-cysteine methyltransferase
MLKKNRVKILIMVALTLTMLFSLTACNVKDRTDMSKYSKYAYIGSVNSKIFHTRECFLGKRIALEDAAFFNTRDAAVRAGYKPDTKGCTP